MRQVLPTEQRLDKAMRGKQESTTKHLEPEILSWSSSETSSETRIKDRLNMRTMRTSCEHHANPVSCACPSRSSSHWRVPLPSASSTSKRPSQSGTCPQSTETNRSETYGEELGWTWMNFAYRVWLLCDLLWLLYIVLQSDHHWHSSPEIRHSESAVRIVLVSFCMP
jgi:hypothetical protein